MKFCSHDCGSSRLGSKLEACKLVLVSSFILYLKLSLLLFCLCLLLIQFRIHQVIPFSNFICKGESLLISSMLKFWNGPEEVGSSQGQNQFFCDGFSYSSSTKKIISSEDLDFVLVGTIKVMSNFLCYLPHVDYTFLLLFILA